MEWSEASISEWKNPKSVCLWVARKLVLASDKSLALRHIIGWFVQASSLFLDLGPRFPSIDSSCVLFKGFPRDRNPEAPPAEPVPEFNSPPSQKLIHSLFSNLFFFFLRARGLFNLWNTHEATHKPEVNKSALGSTCLTVGKVGACVLATTWFYYVLLPNKCGSFFLT